MLFTGGKSDADKAARQSEARNRPAGVRAWGGRKLGPGRAAPLRVVTFGAGKVQCRKG
jgi:hypothetical protein